MSTKPVSYALGSRDCVGYVQKVARELGLSVPPRTDDTLLPNDYVKALKQVATQVRTMNYPGGNSVTAQFIGGLLSDPHAVVITPNGTKFQSPMFGGKFDDHAGVTVTLPDGGHWYGELHNGLPNGGGWYTYPNGQRQLVTYANGVPVRVQSQPPFPTISSPANPVIVQIPLGGNEPAGTITPQ